MRCFEPPPPSMLAKGIIDRNLSLSPGSIEVALECQQHSGYMSVAIGSRVLLLKLPGKLQCHRCGAHDRIPEEVIDRFV